jgi:hypothetical protein
MKNKITVQLRKHLADLWDHQQTLFDQGHTFWHCDAQDASHNKPFYYYQINRSTHMSTCSTCYKLMENRKKIREIEKMLNMPQTPLWTDEKQSEHVKRISVKNGSEWNPNFAYIGG